MDIKVPRIAENISGGIVVAILVKEGDSVKKEQTVIELDTEKAVAAVPTKEDGIVEKILVKLGDNVRVGQTLIRIKTAGTSKQTDTTSQEVSKEKQEKSNVQKEVQHVQEKSPSYKYQSPSGSPPPAAPHVRKVAEDLGIDLTLIQGSERGGRITLQDLKNYIHYLKDVAERGDHVKETAEELTLPDFAKWGRVKKEKAGTVRQKIAEKMTLSWTTIPHVTQFDEADITNLLVFRKKELGEFESKGIRPTVTGYIIKILVPLLKKHRKFNATYNAHAQEILYKEYINLGIAVDTEQGLIVPVIKNIDTMDLATISKELEATADKARKRTLSFDDIQGASFTISNQGGIGGMHFTPIINPPEVAILGIGKAKEMPRIFEGKIVPRTILPLALSYDHRLIDGADTARFMKDFVEILETNKG